MSAPGAIIATVLTELPPQADAVPPHLQAAVRPRAFISYARADGEQIARDLRRRLVAGPPALTVWQDRAELEGGVGWWKQITDALDVVEFLVLLMTPAAQRSDMVQREWRYARQMGVCVYPVFTGGLVPDFGALPRWMRKAHFFNLEREWDTLAAHLARPAVVKRVPFMAPDLVPGFVARPEVMQPLREALRAASGTQVTITTALQGAGGLGKTTMAIALCHDEDLAETFDDGVVWVTLGNEPKLVDELAKVHVALTGRRPAFVDQDDAAYHLAQALQDRNCLIVIDDVWHAAHLKPFLRGGPGCVRLITTRLADIAPDAARIAVDAMNLSQATALLAKGLQPDAPERAGLRQLAARLGEWPLLLELANAQLRRRVDKGDTLTGAIAHATQRLQRDGVTAFDLRRAEQRQEAVARTMQLSMDLLDPGEADAFTRLAVFPEDVEIPLSVAAALWGCDSFDAEELAQLLDDISLARFSLRTGMLRLHDLIRAYAATRLDDATRAHAALATHLAAPAPDALGYAWRWRPYHLVHAGQAQVLCGLLQDPDWLLAKLRHTDVVALGEDFDLVDDATLKLAQQAIRLAAAVLAQDASALPGQLLARLPADPARPQLQALRGRIAACRSLDWLRPLHALSTPAGSPNVGTLVAHSAPVLCLALSDDGTLLASGAADGTLRLWDWRRGKPLATMAGHGGPVRSLAFGAGGDQLASIGEDGRLRVWDCQTGQALGQAVDLLPLVAGPLQQVLAAPSPGAPWWVVAGGALWDVQTGSPDAAPAGSPAAPAAGPRPLIGPQASIDGLAAAGAGLLVGVCGQRHLRLWRRQAAGWQEVWCSRLPHLSAVAAADAAALAFSVGQDGALRRWALDAGPPALPPAPALDPSFDTTQLAVDPQARFLVGAGRAWAVHAWPLAPPGPARALQGHAGPVNAVCVAPDATHALSAADDGSVRVWDLRRPLVAKPRPAHLQAVRALVFTPDAAHAFSTADGQELLLWDSARAEPLGRHTGPGAWRVQTPDGTDWGVWLLAGRRLHCWPLAAGAMSVVLQDGALRVQRIALPDGATLVLDGGRWLDVWGGAPPACLLAAAIGPDFAHDIALTPDGAHLALLGTDGLLSQWQLAPLRPVLRTGAARGVLALAANGMALALAVADAGVQLLQAGAAPRSLPIGRPGLVRDLAFACGAQLLLSAGEDGALRLWDTDRGQLRAAFTTESPLRCCAAAANGALVAAGDDAGQVHFFASVGAREAGDGAAGPG